MRWLSLITHNCIKNPNGQSILSVMMFYSSCLWTSNLSVVLFNIVLTPISLEISSRSTKRGSSCRTSQNQKFTWLKTHMYCVMQRSLSFETLLKVTATIRLVASHHSNRIRKLAQLYVNTLNKNYKLKRVCGRGRQMKWQRQMSDSTHQN